MKLSEEITPDIKPGDDFYRFVNQKWLDAHPLPADKARLGSFDLLSDENTDRLRDLLEARPADDEPANLQKLRQFYAAAMDEGAIEAAGIKAISPLLDQINRLDNAADIGAFITERQAAGFGLLWHLERDLDDKNSRRYLLRVHQGGLGLPDRDYYLEDKPEFSEVRAKYREFLAQAFTLLGMDNEQQRAEVVYGLEESLAKVSATSTERRDADKMYNLLTLGQLKEQAPQFDWVSYFAGIGLEEVHEVVVSHPPFLRGAAALLASGDPEAWKDFLAIHTLLPVMTKLPKAFEDLHFGFYGKVLRGTAEQEPRYRRIIGLCERLLSQPTGQLFVSKYFDESAKRTIYDLVENIQEAFRQRIRQLDWMSETTKQKALEKLDTFLPLLGYPDQWRDFDGLELGDNYAANFLTLVGFEWRYDTSRLAQPVDRQEWLMSPATVNAYYWANTNGITFPAGILQPPFFSADGDFAANYGGIGAVIGHELTHGFDDQGSKFDKTGNLKSWWTDEDRRKFDEAAGRLVQQFNGYQVDGHNLNGQLTLGENIADLGGVLIAFDALQRHLEQSGQKDEVDGFSPEQRFFMAYARIWRQNIRPEMSLQLLVMDPHSPGQFRTNGIVTNVDTFYDAFAVSPGQTLYREPQERVRIW